MRRGAPARVHLKSDPVRRNSVIFFRFVFCFRLLVRVRTAAPYRTVYMHTGRSLRFRGIGQQRPVALFRPCRHKGVFFFFKTIIYTNMPNLNLKLITIQNGLRFRVGCPSFFSRPYCSFD